MAALTCYKPQDQSCQDDSGPVAIGELVEPGRNRTELLETDEASINNVTVAVDVLSKAGGQPRAPRRRQLATWSRRSGVIPTMPGNS